MPNPKTELIRKDSAVLSESLVTNTVTGLLHPDVPVGRGLFGFNPSDPVNQKQVYACDDEPTREWTQHTTEPFLLHTWGAVKTHLPAKGDRPERDVVRLVLIDPEGDTLQFTGDYTIQSFDMLRAMKGDGPFVPALPIVIKHIQTDAGQTMKIRPADAVGKPTSKK